MPIQFQIKRIEDSPYKRYYALTNNELKEIGVHRIKADCKPGFPCVVSLEDAEIGEEILLFANDHLKLNSPFDSKGPIFIRKNAKTADLPKNEIPENLLARMLSVRAYDKNAMMVNAKTIAGIVLKDTIQEMFTSDAANFIHIHISSPGCFNCEVNRV